MMNKDDVVGFLKKAVPWIGAAATGNVPLLVTMAANAVGDALGVKVEATPTAISNAIAGATPEQMMALKAAENDFALKMRELNFKEVTELYASEVLDRNGARDREAKVGDHTNRNLAYAVISSFILMVGCTLMGFTQADSVMAGTLIGYLSAKAEQVLSYYFGSTRNSARKTELLAASAPGK
jgi:hypothetical protein